MKKCGCKMIVPITRKKRDSRGCRHPLYGIYGGIRHRLKPTYPQKEYYFDRGIKISEIWSVDFYTFVEDMGKRPSLNHSVDRANNDLGYCKHNCRWATFGEQAKNSRNWKGSTLPSNIYWKAKNKKYEVTIWRGNQRLNGGLHRKLPDAKKSLAQLIKRTDTELL